MIKIQVHMNVIIVYHMNFFHYQLKIKFFVQSVKEKELMIMIEIILYMKFLFMKY